MFKTAGQEFPGLDYTGQCTLNLERFKQKIQFIPLQRDLISILDALKVSDFACFLISATEPVDVFGDLCLASIKGQGVLSSTFSVVDVNQFYITFPFIDHFLTGNIELGASS